MCGCRVETPSPQKCGHCVFEKSLKSLEQLLFYRIERAGLTDDTTERAGHDSELVVVLKTLRKWLRERSGRRDDVAASSAHIAALELLKKEIS